MPEVGILTLECIATMITLYKGILMLGNNEMKAFCEGLSLVQNNYDAVINYCT